MKNYYVVTVSRLLLFAVICTLFIYPGCKKSSEGKRPHHESEGRFSFTYKGQSYNLPYKSDPPHDWGIEEGIFMINRPDIFGGKIYYRYNQCAYFEPLSISLSFGGTCQITDNGFPFDSTAVYIYQSGSAKNTFTNCESKTVFIIPDGDVTIKICDIDGTINLVLKNKEGKTIEITNGVYKQYNYKS